MEDIIQEAMSGSGNVVSYSLPIASGGEIIVPPQCTPKSKQPFSIGSTQVTCTAKNKVGNMGMTSFMVTVNLFQKLMIRVIS